MRTRLSILGLLFLFTLNCLAAKVDTLDTFSPSMQKTIKAVVITPDGYSKKEKLPIVYLLHGYSGNYKDWITKVSKIQTLADQMNLIIVCPDGNFGSWYLDSPEVKESKYETYVSKELVDIIDKKYSTITSREGRAITGLSMGGHGALVCHAPNQPWRWSYQ